MLRKLRLNLTQIYEKHLIAEEISKMLEDFVNGRPHHLSIGSEQGDIDGWDDIVIEKSNEGNVYIQAKRNRTDFSDDPISRGVITTKKNKGQPMELSPFDSAMKKLGEKIHSIRPEDEFRIELPGENINIKKDLSVRQFTSFWEDHVKELTKEDGLSRLAQCDINTQNTYDWLTTWCGFRDWGHILSVLRVLRIVRTEGDTDIVDRTKRNLSRIINPSDIDHVYRSILGYLDENATITGAIEPRRLLFELQKYILPGIARWTQFKQDDTKTQWQISGIQDLESVGNIERPEIIVPAFWTKENYSYVRHLRICGNCSEGCKVAIGLMRLAAHPVGPIEIYCADASSWKNSIKAWTGGTLGMAGNDLDDLKLISVHEPYMPCEHITLATIDEKETFSGQMHNEMYKVIFKNINIEVIKKVNEMQSGTLRTEMENRWADWKVSLENDIEEQRRLFSKMLHPNAEGGAVSGEVRVGLKTVSLLGEAIYHLLVLSVCLGDDDNQKWASVENGTKVCAIGLAFWSGPMSEARKIMKIDDDTGAKYLLEYESEQIIILPQSDVSEKELLDDRIAGGNLGLMSDPKHPRLLITNNKTYQRILRKGDISELREYFSSKLREYRSSLEDSVSRVVGG
jgi:hypothetical protein